MQRDLILGTAGHIDHGKTALVKALTGIDCDRLPEEKQRGITIDIGFAHLDLGDVRLGIVDVPGHERFVKNMLAGATGIDLALLIVAADDSIMPQTREHLEILGLLGIRQGVIALTKVDLVDETTLQVVELEIRELVAGTFLAEAPIARTSAKSGIGIERLKAALSAAAKDIQVQNQSARFRLSIDRAFTVQGHGTVVTGSVASGAARVGEELDWHKGDDTVERVRIRSLNNHGSAVDAVLRGQRAALNLAGVPHGAIRRGQELCSPGYLVASSLLSARVYASSELLKPLKHRLPVRLHIGTAEVLATLALLDCDRLEPGRWCLAQLSTSEPVAAVWGQPFVLRDSAAERTLGGGRVLQPQAGVLRRRDLDQQVRLELLNSESVEVRALEVAWFAGFKGVEATDLIRGAGVAPEAATSQIERFRAEGKVVELALATNRTLTIHTERLTELERLLLAVLAKLHADNAIVTRHDRQKVLSRLEFIGDESLLQAVVDRAIAARRIVGDSRRIARADFKPKLTANQMKLKDRIVEAYAGAGFQPPEPNEFANRAGGNASALKEIFEVAVAEGFLVKIAEEIYLAAEVDAELRVKVHERLASSRGLSVGEIRDLLGTTRKYAVPICEYLDRSGCTRREGDLRVLAHRDPKVEFPPATT